MAMGARRLTGDPRRPPGSRVSRWARRGCTIGGGLGIVASVAVLLRMALGPSHGVEAIFFTAFVLGYPLSRLSTTAGHVSPPLGWTVLFLSIPVVWGLIGGVLGLACAGLARLVRRP